MADGTPQSARAASEADIVRVGRPSTNRSTWRANLGAGPRAVAKSMKRQGSLRSAKQSVVGPWCASRTVTVPPGSTGVPVAGSVPIGRPWGTQLISSRNSTRWSMPCSSAVADSRVCAKTEGMVPWGTRSSRIGIAGSSVLGPSA
jgi:hypothetical protein